MYHGNVYLDSQRPIQNSSPKMAHITFLLVSHRKSKSSWWTIRQWYSIFICAGPPHSSVVIWVRQLSARVKDYKGAVRRRMKTLYGHFMIWRPATHSIAQTGSRLLVATKAKSAVNPLIFLRSPGEILKPPPPPPVSPMFWLAWHQLNLSCLHPLPINATAFNA